MLLKMEVMGVAAKPCNKHCSCSGTAIARPRLGKKNFNDSAVKGEIKGPAASAFDPLTRRRLESLLSHYKGYPIECCCISSEDAWKHDVWNWGEAS